ncbi:hypothetical protein MMC22_006156 [Lobaria immixta]|nr:hypothetical protein [Lobaria immixta]
MADMLCSLDKYLEDPKTKALLSTDTKKATSRPMNSQPVQLGSPRTSQHVSTLHQLCQKRGIVPEFEIDGDQNDGFGGWLKVGSETISRDERWPKKKDAREGLAERGVEVVKSMQERAQEGVVGPPISWVGLLQTFHSGSIADGGPVFTEYAVGGGFGCTCTIPLSPDPFGSASEFFSSKKAARNNAAKEAMKYLIDQGHVNPDGSVKAKKKAKLGTAVKVEGKKLEVNRDTTYAQRVNELCPLLGVNTPTYRLSAESPSAPNHLSGAAYFSGEPRLPEKYGEVRNVYGKKAAKEEVARGVWEALEELAAERGVKVGVEDEMDKGAD